MGARARLHGASRLASVEPMTRDGRDELTWRAQLLWFLTAIVFVALALLTITAYVRGETGDFVHFYDAARGVLKGEHIYTYGEMETELRWYAYLPLFAVLISPLAVFSMSVAGSLWAVANVCMLVTMMLVGARECVRRLDLPSDRGTTPAVMLVAMLPFLDKIRQGIELGQTDILIGLCMVLGLAWADRRPILAGVVLGIATNVKLQGLIFLPYLLVRRRWRQAGALIASSVAFALGGSLLWGWQRNLEYLRISLGGIGGVLGLGPPPEGTELWGLTWNRSVSIPSVAARGAESFSLPGGTTLIVTALAAGALFALGWWMYRRSGHALFRGRSRGGETEMPGRGLTLLEWSGLIVAALVFSPQTSPRHFIPALLVTSVVASIMVTRAPTWRNTPLLAALVLFGLAMVLPPGGDRFDEAVRAWRAVGGQTWALLVLYFVTLWSGLRLLPVNPAFDTRR